MNRFLAICHNGKHPLTIHFEGYLAETKKIFQEQCKNREYQWALLINEETGDVVDKL